MRKLSNTAVYSFYFSYLFVTLFLSYLAIGFYLFTLQSADNYATIYTNTILFGLIWTAVVFIGAFIWARLSVINYGYELAEEGFKKESGILIKRYVAIPYSKVQNVDIYRGIIDRLLGLSTLVIQTAGISGQVMSEGLLPGLSAQEAIKVREEILKKVK